ncbi:PREDICTED: golgin subfamily A member 6-like protein 1 [Vollenhovia emeryi]|uniref:golgin subfamily A member 6-like protein 1 n=1 Tax=Vollenhovia emeryi TaxID=411798 RepID=UPI0005F4F87A|nr:PREDICTED: golgin subfamily A member 6-like protein 1 [Vollenhovia emeryi]
MIKRLGRYLKDKRLELNVGKTKIIRFRKGGGKNKEAEWRWNKEKIEEVKEFKYLGYTMQKNGGQEAHIREVTKRATAAMGQVWGIGKRKFGGDWKRRMKLFVALVRSIMGYGAEIWGWEERERVERVQERYIRWTLGVDWRTPGYLVREEGKKEKVRTWAGRRAWRFEERLRKGQGTEIARACLKEVEEKERGKGSRWEEGRRRFFEERGYAWEEVKRLQEEGIDMEERLEDRDRKVQEQEAGGKIRESRYNKWYKEIRTEGTPRYLKERGKEKRIRAIARFRLGNEMREGRYWESEEERKCRMCGGEVESWEHVLERCENEGSRWERGKVLELLHEKGGGYEWMKELMEKRKEKMGREWECE